jgi:hypothetical protein
MSGTSQLLGLVRSLAALLLLSPTLAWGGDVALVQQIGALSGKVPEAVAAEVRVVPFSPAIDARTTPIILAPGKIFLTQDAREVRGLSEEERSGIQQAYNAGRTILLLHASVHDIAAVHVLVNEGVTHRSTTHPVVLAYALRRDSNIPTARVVHNVGPSPPAPGGVGPAFEDTGALGRAVDVIISELIHPPVVAAAPMTTPADWRQSPVQSTVITDITNGTYNTPVQIYALHACQENKDYYLVDTGGDWTATEATFGSASWRAGQIQLNSDGSTLTLELQPDTTYCTGGIAIATGDPSSDDLRLCRYTPYPLDYEVDIVPANGPTVVQVNAAPAGNQGLSASYTSGFSFSIGGQVSVSGMGPSGGIQAGVSWNNQVSTTVPPLVIEAGDMGNQGTFTRYKYCTVGSTPQDCMSTIQMVTPPNSGLCENFAVGEPQQGQTPNGRLSNVAQTVTWQVDPATYGGETFNITVSYQVNYAFSQALLWHGPFTDLNTGQQSTDPDLNGYCNLFGCSCEMPYLPYFTRYNVFFHVPIPSSTNCSGG